MDRVDLGIVAGVVVVILLGVGGAYIVADNQTTPGPELVETAVVLDTVYQPSRHSSGVGVGMTTGGNAAVVNTSSFTPAVYATVFKCQHGKFIVYRQQVWATAQPGDTLLIHYKEKFRRYINKGEFAGYDFLYAEKVR